MIELLSYKDESEFLDFCGNSINGAVIYTKYKTFKTGANDGLFWLSRNNDGNINGVYSLLDGCFTYKIDNTADKKEIELFTSVMGVKQITEHPKYILKFVGNDKHTTAQDITGENLKETFSVIFEDDINRNSYFPIWYTDMSHKIRHGFIHGKAVFVNNECISVAFTSGESNDTAVISAVATLKKFRKNGYGENAVVSLANSIDKQVFLMTDNENTAQWYKKIGFTSYSN